MAYDTDLTNRLTQIQQMGTNATGFAQQMSAQTAANTAQAAQDKQAKLQAAADAAWKKQQAAALAKSQASSQAQLVALKKQLAKQAAANNQVTVTTSGQTGEQTSGGTSKSVTVPQGKGNNFENFVSAITSQESGGNYGIVNKSSGALGRYQIMPGNVPSWTKAALGKSLTPQQFLASPKAQDATARHFLQGYYNTYGPAGAAVAWYAGAGTAAKYVKNPGAYNKKQGNYPSINSYAMSILSKMGIG